MRRFLAFVLGMLMVGPTWSVIEFDRPFATATTIPVDFRINTDGSFDTTGTTPDCEFSEGGHDDTPSTFSDATNEATEIATNTGTWFLNVEASESDEAFTYIKCSVATANAMPFYAVINHVPSGGGVGNTITGTSTSTVLQVVEAVVAVDDEWVGHTLVVTEGACKYQGGVVVDSDENTTDTITISPALQTCTPATDLDDVGFILLPQGHANVAASLSGVPWNAAWDAEVESEVDDALGAGGADLTAVAWNAAWDAEVQSEVEDGIDVGLEGVVKAINDNMLFCTVNDANFAPTTTAFQCVVTDLDDGAVTQATGDLEGRLMVATAGAQIREARYISDTTWDAGNTELKLTTSRTWPAALADGVVVIIY